MHFKHYIDKNLIFLNIKGENSTEVLNNIAKILYEKGIVKESFAQAILERESNFPTGLPVGEFNIAIPHTDPEHNNKIAVSVFVPENPVYFKNMGNKEEELKVYVIIVLSLKKTDDSIQMLPSLMEYFANEEYIKEILECKTADEVFDLFTGRKESADVK